MGFSQIGSAVHFRLSSWKVVSLGVFFSLFLQVIELHVAGQHNLIVEKGFWLWYLIQQKALLGLGNYKNVDLVHWMEWIILFLQMVECFQLLLQEDTWLVDFQIVLISN